MQVKRAATLTTAQGDGALRAHGAEWAPARVAKFLREGAFFRATDRRSM